MLSDDDVVAYLAGDQPRDTAAREGPDAGEYAELDDLCALLADAGTWSDPPAELEAAIAAAIAAEARAERTRTGRLPSGTPSAEPEPPLPIASARERRRPFAARRWQALAGAAAAIVLVVAGLTMTITDENDDVVRLSAELAATELSVGVTGSATLTKFDSGWRIELEAPDLPRLDGGDFYQAWLKNADDVAIPVGTFNDGDDVVLWAGVPPLDFPTLTVTHERADGENDSSGLLVLSGPIVED